MADLEIQSASVQETVALGERIGQGLQGGEVFAVTGPLGSGKTHLIKGIVRGCGHPDQDPVSSPTFVLVNRYRLPDGRRLHHADCYRLKDAPLEMWDIGLDDLLAGDDIVVIEWADRIPGLLPDDRLEVAFTYVDDAQRSLTFTPHGVAWDALLARLQAAVESGLPETLDAPCH